MLRSEVYNIIDTERDYQNKKWTDNHSVEEYLFYIEDYLNEARHLLSRNNSRIVKENALEIVRKITALGVSCLEEHGCKKREC